MTRKIYIFAMIAVSLACTANVFADVKIKSNSMQNVAILTNEAQVTAKATYGDVGNYVMIARVIDNGEPGTNDKFGLKLLEPSGRAVADFTFLSSPVLIGGGNNQVPKKK